MNRNSNASVEAEVEALARTYRERVLRSRTRVVSLLGRKCRPQLLHTFLGFELKMGRKRITCPDMATARYLGLFAELGMPRIHIPYDPTETGRLLDEFERPLQKIKAYLLEEKAEKKQRQRKTRRIYASIREKLRKGEIGGRDASPQPQ